MKLSFTLISLSFSLLISTAAYAVESGNSMRVENGVIVKSGTAPTSPISQSLAPEKRAADKKESFPTTPPPPKEPPPPAPVVEEGPPDDDFPPEVEEKVRMKPVYDISKGKPTVNSNDKPFKKSIYSGVSESIKKPDPKPEVSSRPLKEDTISDDIKNLENIRKNKATNAEDGVGESGLPIRRR